MATYTYKCLDCNASFTIEATIQEKEERKGTKFMCPKCHSENIRQEFSVTHFFRNVFKGDSEGGSCCSDKNSCDTQCTPSKQTSSGEGNCCSPKKGGGNCCG